METNEFYSLYDSKKVKVPEEDIKEVMRKGRTFLVGDIMVKGEKKQLWKIKPVLKKRKDGVKQHYHKRVR